jgi:Na+/H+ antiporter 1/RadC-like JAB domain
MPDKIRPMLTPQDWAEYRRRGVHARRARVVRLRRQPTRPSTRIVIGAHAVVRHEQPARAALLDGVALDAGRRLRELAQHRVRIPEQDPSKRGTPRPLLAPFRRFTSIASAGGIMLPVATAIALAWANSQWADSYHNLWGTPLTLGVGGWSVRWTLLHLINDGLMAVFFFLVGLAIKREMLAGELKALRSAALGSPPSDSCASSARTASPRRPATPEPGVPVRSTRDVVALMQPYAEREAGESSWLLPLDSQHRLIGAGPTVITRALLTSSLVHPREVLLAAIAASAAAVVLVHNHPSGDPTRPADDRLVTE